MPCRIDGIQKSEIASDVSNTIFRRASATTMEPSITPPPEAISKPLTDFQVIAHNTYLWTSPSYLSKSPSQTPLILLCAWNDAAAKHIAKYTLSYQKLFPTSRILLIRCFTRDAWRSTSAYVRLLTPAMDLVHEHVQGGGEVLAHSFSNGGGNQLNEFAKAWRARFGSKMPMRIQALDSSPTKGPYMTMHRAVVLGLPRTLFWRIFGSAIVHIGLLFYVLVVTLQGGENKHITIGRELNDENVFDTAVPRVYLFSRADEMVTFEEVEEHVAIAESKGWSVEKVMFEKSPHCGHVREDEAKYWAAIMEAWKMGPRDA
jgi:hypothetical protein